MSSKIEQVIDEIEEFLDGCKFVPFSSTNISVDKEEIEDGIDIIMGGGKDIKEHLESGKDSKKGEK